MIEDRIHWVSGLSETEHCIPRRQNPKQNGKRGCAHFRTPCLVALTSDDHNFLVRTPIHTFLDSTESSLSLEFNKMNFSAKPWAEQWPESRTVEEWSVLVSGTPVFETGLYLK